MNGALHYAECPSFGPKGDRSCPGCVEPEPARDGALICDRCYRRLRFHLDEAPDVVTHLRTRADPMKSGWNFDREKVSSSRPELPAPVAAELLDASDDIMRTLREWALFVQFPGQGWRAAGLEAGISAEDAHDDARACVDVLLDAFDRLVNVTEVEQLAEAVLTRHDRRADVPWWSVADALAKWPLDDRPRWAASPCPRCDKRVVRVVPSRHGRVRFACTDKACQWTGDNRDMFIAEAFETPRVYDLTEPAVSLERVRAFAERARAA